MSHSPNPLSSCFVDSFVSNNKFRTFNVDMAKWLGGVEVAIILCDLIDQFNFLSRAGKLIYHEKYGDGWLFFTAEQAYDRCGIHTKSFRSAIKKLQELGLIKVEKWGIPAKNFYKVDKQAIGDWIFSNISSSYADGHNWSGPKEQLNIPEGTTTIYDPNIKIPIDDPKRKTTEAPNSEASDVCAFFIEKLKASNPKFKMPNVDKWTADIDRMLRRDGHKPEEVKQVLDWAFSCGDEFWENIFQSPETLRKMFPRAWKKMHHKSKKQIEEEAKAKAVELFQKNQDFAQQLRRIQWKSFSQRIEVSDVGVVIILGDERTPIAFSDGKFKEIINNKMRAWGYC